MRSTARPLRTHSAFVLSSHHTTTFAPSLVFLHFSSSIAPGVTASSLADTCRSTVDHIDAHPQPASPSVYRSRIHGPGLLGSTPPRKSVKSLDLPFEMASQQVSLAIVIVYIHPAAKQNAKLSQCLGPTSANTKIRRWKFSNKDEWPSHWPSPR